MGGKPMSESIDSHLKQAQDAAAAGDLKAMVTALFRSPIPDRVARKLRRKWPYLSAEDADYLVAVAVNTVYEQVRDGKKVSRLAGLLVKVSHIGAYKLYQSRPDQEPWAPKELENLARDTSGDPERDAEEHWAKSLAVVRSLLPRIGQEGIRQVMEVIFDAVERGIADIDNKTIAEILGRDNLATVRQHRKRGFDRLKREALKEGLTFDLLAMGLEDEDEDEDEDEEDE